MISLKQKKQIDIFRSFYVKVQKSKQMIRLKSLVLNEEKNDHEVISDFHPSTEEIHSQLGFKSIENSPIKLMSLCKRDSNDKSFSREAEMNKDSQIYQNKYVFWAKGFNRIAQSDTLEDTLSLYKNAISLCQ